MSQKFSSYGFLRETNFWSKLPKFRVSISQCFTFSLSNPHLMSSQKGSWYICTVGCRQNSASSLLRALCLIQETVEHLRGEHWRTEVVYNSISLILFYKVKRVYNLARLSSPWVVVRLSYRWRWKYPWLPQPPESYSCESYAAPIVQSQLVASTNKMSKEDNRREYKELRISAFWICNFR